MRIAAAINFPDHQDRPEEIPLPLIFPVQFVHDTDLERFSEKLGEAIADYSAAGGEPRITFSHAATDDGFDYVALLIGGQNDTMPTEASLPDSA